MRDPLVDEVVARCDRVLVVVAPTVAGVASAARLCAGFPDRSALRLVVRGSRRRAARRRRASPASRCVAAMSDQRGLAESIDLGLGPVRSRRGPLGRAALAVLDYRPRGAGRPHDARPTGRRRRRRPRPARPPARRADPAPRRRGAARDRPPGRRRDRARRPRGAAARRGRRRPARAAAADARRHRRARQRAGRGLPRPRLPGWSGPRSGSPTTRPCAGWPSGWRRRAVGASTTPRRTSTCAWPTAPAATPCSRRSPRPAPSSRCGCRDRGASPSTSWSPPAR